MKTSNISPSRRLLRAGGRWLILLLSAFQLFSFSTFAYPPAPAPQASVNAGTEPYLYVTPKTLSAWPGGDTTHSADALNNATGHAANLTNAANAFTGNFTGNVVANNVVVTNAGVATTITSNSVTTGNATFNGPVSQVVTSANWTPFTDPGDANRNFIIQSTGVAERDAPMLTLRNSDGHTWDMISYYDTEGGVNIAGLAFNVYSGGTYQRVLTLNKNGSLILRGINGGGRISAGSGDVGNYGANNYFAVNPNDGSHTVAIDNVGELINWDTGHYSAWRYMYTADGSNRVEYAAVGVGNKDSMPCFAGALYLEASDANGINFVCRSGTGITADFNRTNGNFSMYADSGGTNIARGTKVFGIERQTGNVTAGTVTANSFIGNVGGATNAAGVMMNQIRTNLATTLTLPAGMTLTASTNSDGTVSWTIVNAGMLTNSAADPVTFNGGLTVNSNTSSGNVRVPNGYLFFNTDNYGWIKREAGQLGFRVHPSDAFSFGTAALQGAGEQEWMNISGSGLLVNVASTNAIGIRDTNGLGHFTYLYASTNSGTPTLYLHGSGSVKIMSSHDYTNIIRLQSAAIVGLIIFSIVHTRWHVKRHVKKQLGK